MPPVALHARPATGLIDATIAILRRRYWDCFLAELIPIAPFLVVAVFVSRAHITYVTYGTGLAAPLAIAIDAWLVSQDFTGEPVSLGDAVRRTLPRSPGLIAVQVVVVLTCLLGLVGLIVGVFVMVAWMYTAIPAYALEDVGASGAIDRSLALARGNVRHILGVALAAWLGYEILRLTIVSLNTWLWGAATRHVYIPPRVDTLVVMIGNLAILPIVHIPHSVVYYDLRIRCEGIDLEAMAAALDDPAPAAPVPNAPAADPA